MIVKYASVKKGNIVLVLFPFADLSGSKTRPALVLGFNRRANRIIVCFIGSRVDTYDKNFDMKIDQSHKDFSITGLKVSSIVKTDKISSFSLAIVYGIIGEIPEDILRRVDEKLKQIFKL